MIRIQGIPVVAERLSAKLKSNSTVKPPAGSAASGRGRVFLPSAQQSRGLVRRGKAPWGLSVVKSR